MKNKLFLCGGILLITLSLNAQNIDSFTVSNPNPKVCDTVQLINLSTNYDSLKWEVSGGYFMGGMGYPFDSVASIIIYDTACFDIRLILKRSSTYDTISSFCAIKAPFPHVIALIGNAIDTIDVFMTYFDPGYTIIPHPCIPVKAHYKTGTVNTKFLGKNILKYYVVLTNNWVDSIERIVYVVDLTDPQISLNGYSDEWIEVMKPYTDKGATVSDNYDKNLKPVITGYVDTTKAGTYKLTYSVTDSSGNGPASVTRTVIVWDSIAPEITLIGDDEYYVEVYHKFVDPGFVITDNSTSGLTTTITGTFYKDYPDSTPTFLGGKSIFYQVKDAGGNSSDLLVGRAIIVGDTTPPVLKWNFVFYLVLEQWQRFDSNFFDSVEVTDNYDTNLNVEMTGTYFTDYLVNYTEGNYYIIFNVKDLSGNKADSITINIKVVNFISTPDVSNPIATLFPNPSNGQFTLELGEAQIADYIRIFDVSGKQIMHMDQPQQKNEIQMPVHCKGLYIVQVGMANGIYTSRMMVR